MLEIVLREDGSLPVDVSREDVVDVSLDLSFVKDFSSVDTSLCRCVDIITFTAQQGGELDIRTKRQLNQKKDSTVSSSLLSFCFRGSLFPSLTSLSLNNLFFTEKDFALLCESLHPQRGRLNVQTITLYRCGINGARAVELSVSLRGAVNITQLDLTSNWMCDEGVSAVVDALSYHEMKLQRLSLGNNDFGDESECNLV